MISYARSRKFTRTNTHVFAYRLPDPVIPEGPRRGIWLQAADMPRGTDRAAAFEDCAADLPDANRIILDAVIKHLHKISLNAEVNKMKPSNLGVCFGPTLLWSKDGDLLQISACNKVVETLIEDYIEIGSSLLPEGSVVGEFARRCSAYTYVGARGHYGGRNTSPACQSPLNTVPLFFY